MTVYTDTYPDLNRLQRRTIDPKNCGVPPGCPRVGSVIEIQGLLPDGQRGRFQVVKYQSGCGSDSGFLMYVKPLCCKFCGKLPYHGTNADGLVGLDLHYAKQSTTIFQAPKRKRRKTS